MMNSLSVSRRESAFSGTVSSTISESLLDSSTLSSDDFESESSSSTLSFYSSRSRTVSSTSSEAEFASLESDESSGSECSSTSESDEEAPEILVPFVGRHKWKYDCRSFWSDEPDDRSIQETIDEEDVPKIPLSKLLASGEVLKHPISFRDLLALANYASKNVHKGHKVQREDLINVTEHVGALSIQSVFTVAVKYQQYIVGLQRQRPEQILKSYERPALPPGFDCLHARSSLDRNVNRFPFFDRCVDWYCVPLHVYQRIVKETLIQMYDKAQLLKERRKVEKQMEKLRVKENNVFMNPIAAVAATANTNEMDPLVQEEVERVQFRRPRARNQILNDESPAKKTIFAEYWSADVVQRGLKSGELIEGVVRINPRNYEESYISNPQGSAYPDIAILGMADRNRALNGDVAVCKLKDRSLWIVKQEAYEKWCSEKQSTFRSVAEHCTQAAPQRDKEVEAEFSEFISSFTPSPQCLQNLDKASPSPCDMTYDRDELLRCLAKIELTRRLSKTEEVEGSPALRGLSQGENEATELNWYFKQGFKSFDRDVFEKLVDINVYKQLGTSPGNHLSDNDDGDVMEHPPGLMKRQRKPSNPVAETSSSDSETKKKAKKDVVENLDSKVKQQLKHSIRRGIIREENRRKKDGEKYLECVHPQVTKEMQNIHKKANNSHQNRRPILKNTFTQKFVEDLPLSQRDIPDYCLQKTAQIVAISEKKHTRMAVGSLKPFTGNNFVLFSPQDSRIPRLVIDVACVPDFYENTSAYEGKIYLCRMVDWYANAQFARGTLVQCLGKAGDIETETEGILSKMHFDTREYPDEFTEEILPEVFSMADAEKRKRKDFTNECIFTIDPKTARDLDDALHVKKLDDDQYEVGVHIADVSHFVKEGTKVDAWARERTTSVYMVQKVIPMLPRLLCEELCSLQPGVERLAFSVIWKMDKNFKIIDKKTVFCRSIIKSCIKLSYEHAQDIIDGKTDLELPDIHGSHTVENIKNSVLLLYEISKVLKRNRIKNGALRLDGPKMCFDIDDEGLPRSVLVYERKEANFLVEEFMLLANIEVATKINKKFPKLAFLRRHEAPKELVLEATLKQLENLGISIDGRSSGTISESLRKYEENRKTKNTIAQLLVHLLMKPMQLAKYFCVATVPDEIDYRHYALSVPLYTHFTSPIRRYPDVIVHRLLAAAIDPDHYSPPTQSVEQLTRIAKRCNEKKYDAKTASEESDELFFNTLLRKKGNIETLGIVVQVTQVSLEVLLVKYGIVDRIAFKNIPHAKCNPHCSTDSPSLEIVWENNEFGTIKLRMLSVVKVLLKPNPAHCINRMATMEPISVEGLTKLKAKLEKTDLNDL
ncbi:hypothetical protein QR680_016658 [Steinernema hermaphroditum]|uniref:DIS3-like exonuclease 2 n=1 Tax=Steinernema hermaphroditum TaxID=289476 RepID=A0AA39LN00_9BILA|nr:hypothetical protein QR680_016658 [Steinernema hermaphroditum]